MWREPRHSDALLATTVGEVAFRQHGVISLEQLRTLDVSRNRVRRWVQRGLLHRLHRGVYAVGHRRITPRGRVWAAFLACGGPERALLSHHTAGWLYDLMPLPATVDVTTRAASRSMPGIRVHRGGRVERHEVEGLPLTSPTRTLLDLATVLTEHELERVCHKAEQRRLHVEPFGGERGAKRLRKVLARLDEPQITRHELEERFLVLLRTARLPQPRCNARVLGMEVDFLWPEHRLAVETDGAATHLTRQAFERDRERDRTLTLGGYRVVRFTWRQVVGDARSVADTLRALICSRAP